MEAALTQMNIRIDADLKTRADRALEAAGLTPTKAVRALWERIAELEDRPQEIAKLIAPAGASDGPSLEDERVRKLEAARMGAQIVSNALEGRGIDAASIDDDLSYKELRERALMERLGERGLDR